MTPATNRQIPDSAILDHFNKQVYLGNRYSFTLAFTAAGTTETVSFLLQNPAQTTVAFPSQSGPSALFVDLRRMSGNTAITTANIMRVYLNPTVTAVGTARIPLNMRPASPNVSIASLHSAPTISANGTLIEAISSSAPNSVSSGELIILDPGQNLLITLQTETSAVISAALGWYEV